VSHKLARHDIDRSDAKITTDQYPSLQILHENVFFSIYHICIIFQDIYNIRYTRLIKEAN